LEKGKAMNTSTYNPEELVNWDYKYGFVTDIETDTVPRGINREIVRLISGKKHEPNFMLDWRLKAYRHWEKLEESQAEPKWANDKDGKGGIYNFVTKRGKCVGVNSKISWTQVETGSAITWKYPSCILQGDNSVGEFYSVALTNNYQQADTGTKMIHIGKNTKSTIISKGISAGHGQNTYRGLVKVMNGATGARNYSQCDSLLLGDKCGAHTFPYLEVMNNSSQVEHEASTSKIGEDQLFYCRQRGISPEDAVTLIVNGFCKQVFRELPMEFAVEAQKLLGVSLEGSVG
jgi:Fe-S cluster assembly protein SufB